MSRHQQGRIRLPEDAQAELTRRRAQSERITGIFIRQIYTNLAGFTRCRVGSVRGPWVLDLGPFDQATAAARTAKLGRAWRSGTIAAPKEWAYPSYPLKLNTLQVLGWYRQTPISTLQVVESFSIEDLAFLNSHSPSINRPKVRLWIHL